MRDVGIDSISVFPSHPMFRDSKVQLELQDAGVSFSTSVPICALSSIFPIFSLPLLLSLSCIAVFISYFVFVSFPVFAFAFVFASVTVFASVFVFVFALSFHVHLLLNKVNV